MKTAKYLAAVLVGVLMVFPAVAHAAEGETSFPWGASDEQVEQALAAFDGFTGNAADGDMSAAALPEQGGVSTYAGDNMFETAVAEAKAAYPKGSTSAVIAGPGDAWVDALASAGLAASRGPILFAQSDGLGAVTKQALADLGVKRVVIVGGTASVSEAVVADLSAAGIEVEARLAGDNCYGTQMAIYAFGAERQLWNPETVLIATGTSFGDALSASPVAFEARAPIFLVDAAGELSANAREALDELGKNGVLRNVVVLGGIASVPQAIEDYLRTLIPEQGAEFYRLFGSNQYETSTSIASWAVENRGFTWTDVAFTTGLLPYDALAGSVLQGTTKAPLMLVDSTDSATIVLLGGYRAKIEAIRFFGGTATIPEELRAYIVARLSNGAMREATGISYDAMLDLEVAYIEAVDDMLGESAKLKYTREDIDEYMNPDRFAFGDGEFYQFAVLNEGYSGRVTADQINAFVARYGLNGKLVGQGDAFIAAAKESGVNEVFLLALAIIESGWGTSSLAMGTVVNGTTYYNFFGIGAGDANPQGGGSAAANEYGWDSPENCVKGAGSWIARQFLNNRYGQNTLYKMKWNYVQAATEGAVWKKYASGRTWATGIAVVMANFYDYCKVAPEDTGLVYLVPQYRQ